MIFALCPPVKAVKVFSVNADISLKDIEKEQIRSFIVPGGNITVIDHIDVKLYLQDLKKHNILLAGICAGIDILDMV